MKYTEGQQPSTAGYIDPETALPMPAHRTHRSRAPRSRRSRRRDRRRSLHIEAARGGRPWRVRAMLRE